MDDSDESGAVSAITVRLNERETECLDILLTDLKTIFRRADIERNGFATANPDSFVTKTLAVRHAIVKMASQIESTTEPA